MILWLKKVKNSLQVMVAAFYAVEVTHVLVLHCSSPQNWAVVVVVVGHLYATEGAFNDRHWGRGGQDRIRILKVIIIFMQNKYFFKT
jgi:hypothetical protein